MARTAQAESPTKDKLLNAAQELMLAQGFAATSVDEICEAAGLTKGSFFHYFESKDDLGKQLLKRFCEQGAQLHAGFCQQETDPLKRVYSYIDGTIKMATDPEMGKGCLLGLFAQELCDTNTEIQQACKKGFDDWGRAFGEELARAKARYAPKASFEPRELADHLIAIMEGSMIIGKSRKDMGVAGKNLKHFKAYIQALFERPA